MVKHNSMTILKALLAGYTVSLDGTDFKLSKGGDVLEFPHPTGFLEVPEGKYFLSRVVHEYNPKRPKEIGKAYHMGAEMDLSYFLQLCDKIDEKELFRVSSGLSLMNINQSGIMGGGRSRE